MRRSRPRLAFLRRHEVPGGGHAVHRELWAGAMAMAYRPLRRPYTRALASEHLQGSAAVGDARGAELEALCKGWVQPASFR